MRKKYKKHISLAGFDKLFRDYVEIKIIKPMIEYGFVEIDRSFKMEISGKRLEDSPVAYRMLSRGLAIRGTMIAPARNINMNRLGFVYSINFLQNDYKGKMIFKSDSKLAKRVSTHLRESNQYYKIK